MKSDDEDCDRKAKKRGKDTNYTKHTHNYYYSYYYADYFNLINWHYYLWSPISIADPWSSEDRVKEMRREMFCKYCKKYLDFCHYEEDPLPRYHFVREK